MLYHFMGDKHTHALMCCIPRKPKMVAGESSGHHDLEKILKDQRAKPCILPLQYLQDITNNFSEDRELGRGAFGVVYKVRTYAKCRIYHIFQNLKDICH